MTLVCFKRFWILVIMDLFNHWLDVLSCIEESCSLNPKPPDYSKLGVVVVGGDPLVGVSGDGSCVAAIHPLGFQVLTLSATTHVQVLPSDTTLNNINAGQNHDLLKVLKVWPIMIILPCLFIFSLTLREEGITLNCGIITCFTLQSYMGDKMASFRVASSWLSLIEIQSSAIQTIQCKYEQRH